MTNHLYLKVTPTYITYPTPAVSTPLADMELMGREVVSRQGIGWYYNSFRYMSVLAE
jgi:hypothetical protein